jgi:phospho-N-acetylmuramoyl-pentapeptide-transferase
MEHRPADSRRRSAGSHGQTRHADDGRRADSRFGFDLDFAVGAAVECLRLDGDDRDAAVRAIGFADDYSKMAKQRSLGLTGRQKLLAQLLIAVGVWAVLFISTKYLGQRLLVERQHSFFQATADPNGSVLSVPYLYLVLIVIVLLGSSNAVNLTDGLDGLAISVTFIAMTALTGFTYLSSDARWARYLELTHRPEAAELTVFCGAMAGASLGFLWYNAPPAEVFMGDVGSLAIGGAMGTVAVLTKQEFMLLMVGGVFVIEALSVMLQVGVFKMTKRTTGTGRAF